jgi:DNA-binding NarL/FixJ family response regulator
MTIRVVIADDQEMVRTGLTHMINADPALQVVGAAEDGRIALAMIADLKPDVCVLDIRMPSMTGLEVTQRLVSDPNAPKIVIVTTYDREEYLLEALQAGASGFVVKDAPAAVLTGAIHAAANGDALISPSLTHRLIDTYVDAHPISRDESSALTPREAEVLAAVCAGATNDEIADQLHMALSTVKGHISSMMHKTAATNRVKLVIWAYRNTEIRPS